MTICQPIQPCPCHPWSIAPGDQQPLFIDWGGWLASVPGYALNDIESAELIDLNVNPPAPADPDEMKLVSGMDVDPVPSTPGFTNIVGTATENIVKAGAGVPVASLPAQPRRRRARLLRTQDHRPRLRLHQHGAVRPPVGAS
jgi:hypothetical protein